MTIVIELIDIHKHYGHVKANNGVSLTINDGSIHAILGENGAGKSTLMKILAGYIQKTSGTIRVNGKEVVFTSTAHASELGIGMLYQDPMDFPQLTVLENFMIGQSSGLFLKKKHFLKTFYNLCETLDFAIDPNVLVKTLTVGERQQLEIIRLLSTGINVLILDEPTTGISDQQKETLFSALVKLTEQGKSVVLVSHKLEDVDALCDTITVLRQGKVTGSMGLPFHTETILDMMFESQPVPPSRLNLQTGNKIFSFNNVTAKGGRVGLNQCSISFSQNEIVGLAGLEGSGQGVFLRVASGLQKPSNGTVFFENHNITKKNHVYYQNSGISFLPTSRLEEGLISNMNLLQHFALNAKPKKFLVQRKLASDQASHSIDKFNIKAFPKSPVETLSGGNQQRVLLSLLPDNPKLLLLENPTRGLDLESANWVWKYLQNFCRNSKASLVFTSAELDEILMVADRVVVFFNGSIVLDKLTNDTSITELGSAIAGKV